jgi:hypothetical protein
MPSIGQTWVLGSIGAVVEMGVLSYVEMTAYGVYLIVAVLPYARGRGFDSRSIYCVNQFVFFFIW